MRKLIAVAALALALATPAFGADSSTFQLRDAGDLVAICSMPASDPNHLNATGFCHGVLTGAFRYYEATIGRDKRFVCAPHPTPTRAKVMNDFVAWSRGHAASMKDPAIDTLFKYLAETYPCKA